MILTLRPQHGRCECNDTGARPPGVRSSRRTTQQVRVVPAVLAALTPGPQVIQERAVGFPGEQTL